MRRWLVRLFVAVAVMITVAFVVPFAYLINETARDRALDAARADVAAISPLLVAEVEESRLVAAMEATAAGAEGRMSLIRSDGLVVVGAEGPAADPALLTTSSGTSDVSGGRQVTARVVGPDGRVAVVAVMVPSSTLRSGVTIAYVALFAVAAILMFYAVVIADRLARTVVQPVTELVTATTAMGDGDLSARVEPSGPPELEALGESFNQLGDQFELTLDRERELLSALSHRLRTPMTAIRLKVEKVGDPELAAALDRDVSEMSAIISELVTVGRREADGVGGGLCDAAVVVGERFRYWEPLAEDQGRAALLHVEPGPTTVRMGARDLGAVVENLLENVFSHTPEGAAYSVTVTPFADRLDLTVSDEGPGFAGGQVTPGVSSSGSTGLGLHLARSLVERSGGRFDVATSEPGATILVSLPLGSSAVTVGS